MQTKKENKRKPTPEALAFGKRLRMVMRIKKMDQVDLIAQTGLNKSMVSLWYNGWRKAGPKNNRILANCLECDDEWLATGEGEPLPLDDHIAAGAYDELKHKTVQPSGRITTPNDIPVVGKVPAGSPNTNDWDVEYHIQVPGMPAHCYAMLVTGDSMEPRIMEGEHVIFTIDYILEPGNVVIVNNEYGESMVKRYQEKDGKQYLVSDNSRYKPVEPNDGYSIVGKVINSVLIKKH